MLRETEHHRYNTVYLPWRQDTEYPNGIQHLCVVCCKQGRGPLSPAIKSGVSRDKGWVLTCGMLAVRVDLYGDQAEREHTDHAAERQEEGEVSITAR